MNNLLLAVWGALGIAQPAYENDIIQPDLVLSAQIGYKDAFLYVNHTSPGVKKYGQGGGFNILGIGAGATHTFDNGIRLSAKYGYYDLDSHFKPKVAYEIGQTALNEKRDCFPQQQDFCYDNGGYHAFFEDISLEYKGDWGYEVSVGYKIFELTYQGLTAHESIVGSNPWSPNYWEEYNNIPMSNISLGIRLQLGGK